MVKTNSNSDYKVKTNLQKTPQTNTTYKTQTNTISTIKKNTGYTNINNPKINYMTQENKTEEVNLSIENGTQKIDISNVNLDRISVSSDSALNEKFVKVNKDIWSKANLVAINNGNGTFLIKNGNIPIGYTDAKGIKIKNNNTNINTNNTKININASRNYKTPVIEFGDISYKNGLYYDRDTKKLLYYDEQNPYQKSLDLTYLIDNGLITFSKIPSAEIKKIKNGYELDIFDNSSIVLKDKYVIDKDTKGKTKELYQNSNGNLKTINGNMLYNDVDEKISEKITPIKKSDLDKFYNELIKTNPSLKSLSKEEVLNSNLNSKLERYYYYIDDIFDDSMTYSDKKKYSNLLESADNKNYNKILYSTPILKNDKIDSSVNDYDYEGYCLDFYNENGINVKVPLATYTTEKTSDGEKAIPQKSDNDKINEMTNISGKYYSEIMKNGKENYSKKFDETIKNNLEDIIMVYGDDKFTKKNWAAFSVGKAEPMKSQVVISLDCVKATPEYMTDAYTHELGHCYGCSTDKGDFNRIENSETWTKIYNQVNENDPDHSLIGDYAHSSMFELFAESTAFYFNSGKYDFYNENNLKAVEIDVDGYDNLYDYMKSIYG